MKVVKESLYEAINMDEVAWKMDKWMPNDVDLQDEYYEIIEDEQLDDDEKISALVDFIDVHANEDQLHSYLEGRTVEELASHIILNESLNESKKIDGLANAELKDIHRENPESKEGILAKTELKRRAEVNGDPEPGEVNEDHSNLPAGAESDPNAPYNDITIYNNPIKSNDIKYVAIWNNDEWVLFEDEEGDQWIFDWSGLEKDELVDYADDIPMEYEEDEDGWSHGVDKNFIDEWEPDLDTFTNAINDNMDSLDIGEGVQGLESDANMIKVDALLKQEIGTIPWYQLQK